MFAAETPVSDVFASLINGTAYAVHPAQHTTNYRIAVVVDIRWQAMELSVNTAVFSEYSYACNRPFHTPIFSV